MMAAPACRIDALAIGGVQSGCFFYSPANSRFMTDQQQPTRDDNQQDGSWESMISPPPLTATTASYEPVAVPSAGFLTAPPQSAAPTAPPQSAAFAPIQQQQQQSPIIDPFRMQYPSRINNNNRMPPIPSLMNCGIYQTPTAAPSHQPYVAAGHWQPGTSLGASATSSPVHQHHLHSSAASNPVIQMAAAAAAAAAAQMLAPGQQQQMPGVMQPQQQQPTHTAQNQTTQHNVGGMMASMGPAPPQQHMYNPANALGAHTQLDPNVIALMQNPTLAYKLLSTFFATPNQMQQQQQQHHQQQPPPPASTIYAAGPLITGPAEAFIRQQLQQQQYRQQQMQQQHQQHQHQQQQSTNSLAPNLKSLSLDDSSTSNSNDSQRITGGASDMTSSTAVVVTGGGDSGGSGGGCGQANDSDSTGNERVTYRPFHAPVPGNTRRQQHTFYRNTRISNNTNNNCGATNWPPAYTRQYSNNNKYKRDNDDRAYTNNNNNNNNNNQHEYRPTRRSNYSFPRRSAPHPREHSQDVSQRIGRWDAIRDLAYSYRRDGGNASNRGSSRYFDRPVNDFRPRNHDGDRRNIDSDGMTPRNPALELTLFANPSAAINFDQYEKIPVEVKGIDDLEPISSFCDVGFHPILRNSVSLAGYDKPTPVQKYTIPSILRSRDIMSCAQTGSGKTAAFLLPIINHMLNQSMLCRLPSNDQARAEDEARFLQSPRCLILAPTRELCVQIFNEARKFAYRSLLRIVVVYGGTTLRPQLKEIYKGVDIVVATPGRLIDVVERSCLRLDEIRWLVLDEADRMLDMGFEPQIRRIVDDLNMPDKMNRQTAMFSATFPKPIRELAKQFLKDYVFLTVGRIGSTNENIEQRILWVEELDKLDVLIDILGSSRGDEAQQPLTLVFVETKRGADELEQRLRKSGLNVGCIHGDRNQLDREYALNQFRNGHISVLVATAVAARGLDVSNVFHVVNYDLPTDIDDYIHRIGRTGRGGNEGVATSFFNDKNTNLAGDLLSVLTESKQEVPDFLIRMQDQGRFRRFDNRRGYRGARSANYRHHTRNSSGMPFRHYNNTRGLSGGQQCSGFGRRFSAATTTTTAGEMAAADNRGKT